MHFTDGSRNHLVHSLPNLLHMITLDRDRCHKVAGAIKTLKTRKTFYSRPFLSFDADRETKLRIYLLSAAICHQTHKLHHPDLNLWGWDYLEHGFLKMLEEKNVLLNPGYISICREPDIEGMLLAAFSPDGNPAHCSLDRIPERASMIMEICRELKQNHNSKASDLIDQSEGLLINKGKGLYESLSQFMAFEDPLKKKISFFIKLATDAGVLRVRDSENMIPIMDYHMQRVLLRMGCIDLRDDAIRKDLAEKRQLASDSEVRTACIDAVKVIASVSGYDVLKMNDFLWPLGRSCCNTVALCEAGRCMKNPCTFEQVAELEKHHRCYFENVCRGSSDSAFRNLWEPVVDTHFY